VTYWEEKLSNANCRITAPRRAVMRALLETDVPMDPKAILRAGQAYHANLGLVTVYRTLDLYEELGIAHRVHLSDGCHGYLPTQPGHRHVVVCQRCGRSREFMGRDDLATLVERVETHTGYRIEDHLLQLFGVCPTCREATTNEGP
jgi:Fur family transcriptional regulator, ferric uptake regulator